MSFLKKLLITLIALAPVALLLTINQDSFPWFKPGTVKPQQAAESRASEEERQAQMIEAGFKAFQQTYAAEFNNYQREISDQWGEFKDPGPSTWVSYTESGKVRRSVDFRSGQVEVEMLVDKGSGVDPVRQALDQAVYSLMNSTQKSAYESDVVATRVEQKLSQLGDVLQTGELGDERLFSLDDLVSIRINHNGFFKVWYKPRSNVAITDVRASAKEGKDIVRVSFRIPHSIHEKAVKYAAAVTTSAEKEQISDELIYAIMETESSFNPMAKSPIPAYGLMQIVPHTAGKDATRYLYGKPKVLAPSYLYKAQNNIAIGAAYLHVLNYHYLRRVKNEESRMYCAIAAYNTGASNVAMAFINKASFNQAVPEINKLTADQVYEKLRNYLPRKETRNYVEKVAQRMEKYK